MATKKVLIVYASGFGSMADAAEVMVEELCSINMEVEVQSADIARAPQVDEAVAIGSAIRYGRWLPEAMHYLNRNEVSQGL